MNKNHKEIYCWKIQIEDLSVYLASSKSGAVKVNLALKEGMGALKYFQNRFPQYNLFEDAEINDPLVKAVEARLMNKPINDRLSFDIPCTPFQLMTWKAIAQIPFGQTKTYGEIAEMIGKKGGARAVGQAMNKNPLPVIFP
jgi:O6-methylguanine-DNA--protein-cysteine methyltransferase